jgi:predicted metal-dependent hydrolase
MTTTSSSPRFTVPQPWNRWWWGGDAFKTHLGNTFSLFFPEGERMLIRTVRAAPESVRESVGIERVDRFCREEGAHAREHQRFLLPLEGSRAAARLSALSRLIFRSIDGLPLSFRLAIGAAAEHAASSFGRIGLELDATRDAEPELKALFDWHAREEIGHRALVFDVFVANGGAWPLRMLGYAASSLLLTAYFFLGALMLLSEDGVLFRRATWASAFAQNKEIALRSSALQLALHYVSPRFHPSLDGSDDVLALKQVAS